MPASRRANILESIAANVRRLRLRRGMTQAQLAEAADVETRHVQRTERGTTDLGVLMLARLADALGVRPGLLFRAADLEPRPRGRPAKKRGAPARPSAPR